MSATPCHRSRPQVTRCWLKNTAADPSRVGQPPDPSVKAERRRHRGSRLSSRKSGVADCLIRSEAPQSGPDGKISRRLDLPGEAQPLEAPDQPPAEIDLAGKQAQLRGAWEGVVIVVPALAHADEAGEGNVVALRRGALDDPGLAAATVREMADEPVTGDADTDPHRDPPDHPAPAADGEEQQRQGHLLQHPGALHERVEPVVGEALLQPEPAADVSGPGGSASATRHRARSRRRGGNRRGRPAAAAPSRGSRAAGPCRTDRPCRPACPGRRRGAPARAGTRSCRE